MLGAMDKRVSEEVRSREGQWGGDNWGGLLTVLRLRSWTAPPPPTGAATGGGLALPLAILPVFPPRA